MELPPKIYNSVKIGAQGDFDIVVGLTRDLVEQQKKYSADDSDTDLQRFTKDKMRFVHGSYENWYKKVRTPFALVERKTGTLAATVRVGPNALFEEKDDWHTVAWRSYRPFRGTGIMKNFTKVVLDFYKKNYPDAKLWATITRDNVGSIKLAEKLGFVADDSRSKRKTEERRREVLVMINQ